MFSFFVNTDSNIDNLITINKLFGPNDTTFSDSLEIKFNQNDIELIAPYNCLARVIPSPDQNTSGYALRLKPKPKVFETFTELFKLGYLTEIPSYIIIDGINYFGCLPEFIVCHCEEQWKEPIVNAISEGNEEVVNKLSEHITSGIISVKFNAGDVIATQFAPEHLINIKIITSKWNIKQPQFSGDIYQAWNKMDPHAFYSGLVKYNQTTSIFNNDVDHLKIKAWLEQNNRLLVEFRDEHNVPISNTHDYRNSFEVMDATENERYMGYELNNGIAYFPKTNLSIKLKGWDQNDEIFAFDSINNNSQILNQGTVLNYNINDVKTKNLPSQIVVILLNISQWFDKQKAKQMSGFDSLNHYTLGNTVTFLIDGFEYFTDLYNEIIKIRPENGEDYFHILAWWMDPLNTYLIENDTSTNLQWALSKIANTNPSKIRAIVYDHPFWDIYHLEGGTLDWRLILDTLQAEYVKDDNGLPNSIPTGLPYSEGDHHIKIVSINNSNGQIGYCGGIDLHPNRMTGSEHRIGNVERLHDVHCKVIGPAGLELEKVFRDRWMSHDDSDPKDLTNMQIPEDQTQGVAVQVACTIPKNNTYKFAFEGDTAIYNTLKKAISNAKRYIYIEDQYFANEEIALLLKNKLDDLDFIVIVGPGPLLHSQALEAVRKTGNIANYIGDLLGVIALPTTESILFLTSLLWSFIHSENDISFGEFRDIINEHSLASEKFVACYLKNNKGEIIFPHSKLWIIDDIFISCGSANIDARGMGQIHKSDGKIETAASTECNLMCIDTQVNQEGTRKLARDLRIRLWLEHYGKPIMRNEKIEDTGLIDLFSDPKKCFEEIWKKEKGRIRKF